MNELLIWLSKNPGVTITLTVLVAVFVASIILIYLVAFIQGREISFWPPKIGENPDRGKIGKLDNSATTDNKSSRSITNFDLTGTWQCDDGAIYYIRQIGNEIFWLGELPVEAPRFCNVAFGTIESNEVKIRYADIPKGVNRYFGTLILNISANGSRLTATVKNGKFGGSIWARKIS